MAGLAGLGIGAWQGGMVGLTRESYKLAPFHDDIQSGRYLIMVDVEPDNRSQVRELINMNFPQVQRCGSSNTVINPLERPVRVYRQPTH